MLMSAGGLIATDTDTCIITVLGEGVDLWIENADIVLSDLDPACGDIVNIEATIHNSGQSNEIPIDWKVCGEFHLTYRSHPDGCEWARPIWIGDNSSYIGVWAYGGYSNINSYRDTIILKTSGYGPDLPPIGPDSFFNGSLCHYYSSRGGSGYYDDGYYVEFWYQSSDNMFYGKICDAADHSNVYASGSIEAKNFTFSDFSVGRCLGTDQTGWNGVPIIYEGWVDDVEFHWSEDGIPGYENSVTYDFTSTDGFTKADDQTYSDVYWDSGNENVFFHADRRDPWDSGERLEQTLPVALTNFESQSQSWVKQGMVLDYGSFNPGVQYPFVLKEDEIYKMWYTGLYSSTNGEIYYATSSDGMNWTEQGCVLPKPSGVNYAVAPSVLAEDDGTYKMWFSCQDYSWKARTYLATSNDGVNWADQGVVLDIGPPGSPDSQYAVQAKVFKDDGLYKMYYKSYDDTTTTYFMYATSTDGYSWTKHGVVMDLSPNYTGMGCPFVVKNENETYTMWYHAGQNGVARIHVAYSTDGLNWTQGGVDLDVGEPGELDDDKVFCPYVLEDSATGIESMYYAGSDGSKTRIFLAKKESSFSGVDATCTVSFYLDLIAEENLIDRQTEIFVSAGGETIVYTDWLANVSGEHIIIIEISDVNPPDYNLSNNVASAQVFVESLEVDLSIYDE
ncbi:MAG: hypothetical protein KAX31_06975, partial [Thermoplasmata archaeon]|nr:hypothetical protein [Thermoplasmata archaeon]